MNRDEFMARLAHLLVEMPENERMEAIRYYNDYFDEAGEENESSVIRELGSPEKVAASIKANLQEESARANTSQGNTAYQRNEWQQDDGSNDKNWKETCTDLLHKPKSTTGMVVLVLVVLAALPILLGIGGGVLGGVLGLLGGAIGLLLACLGGGLGLVFGGIAIFVKGILNIFEMPAMGLAGLGGGLLSIAIGLVLLVFFKWICFQILPRLFRTVINFISRMMKKRKENPVQ